MLQAEKKECDADLTQKCGIKEKELIGKTICFLLRANYRSLRLPPLADLDYSKFINIINNTSKQIPMDITGLQVYKETYVENNKCMENLAIQATLTRKKKEGQEGFLLEFSKIFLKSNHIRLVFSEEFKFQSQIREIITSILRVLKKQIDGMITFLSFVFLIDSKETIWLSQIDKCIVFQSDKMKLKKQLKRKRTESNQEDSSPLSFRETPRKERYASNITVQMRKILLKAEQKRHGSTFESRETSTTQKYQKKDLNGDKSTERLNMNNICLEYFHRDKQDAFNFEEEKTSSGNSKYTDSQVFNNLLKINKVNILNKMKEQKNKNYEEVNRKVTLAESDFTEASRNNSELIPIYNLNSKTLIKPNYSKKDQKDIKLQKATHLSTNNINITIPKNTILQFQKIERDNSGIGNSNIEKFRKINIPFDQKGPKTQMSFASSANESLDQKRVRSAIEGSRIKLYQKNQQETTTKLTSNTNNSRELKTNLVNIAPFLSWEKEDHQEERNNQRESQPTPSFPFYKKSSSQKCTQIKSKGLVDTGNSISKFDNTFSLELNKQLKITLPRTYALESRNLSCTRSKSNSITSRKQQKRLEKEREEKEHKKTKENEMDKIDKAKDKTFKTVNNGDLIKLKRTKLIKAKTGKSIKI